MPFDVGIELDLSSLPIFVTFLGGGYKGPYLAVLSAYSDFARGSLLVIRGLYGMLGIQLGLTVQSKHFPCRTMALAPIEQRAPTDLPNYLLCWGWSSHAGTLLDNPPFSGSMGAFVCPRYPDTGHSELCQEPGRLVDQCHE